MSALITICVRLRNRLIVAVMGFAVAAYAIVLAAWWAGALS
jgi:hypothetical protein